MDLRALSQSRSASLALAAVLFALDRITKLAIAESTPVYWSQAVIPGFFNLVHTRNEGIAFSLFADAGPFVKDIVLPALSAAAVIVLIVYFWRKSAFSWRTNLALTLLLAGAAGNLYDRAVYGYVVDFLDFHAAGWHWPAFNVADSCITVGAGLLLLESTRKEAASNQRKARSA